MTAFPTFRRCLAVAIAEIVAAQDELSTLDSHAGDGDHGVTMTLAARSVGQVLLDESIGPGADVLLLKLAAAMGSVGGTIGPVYAVALARMADLARDSASPSAPSTDDLLRYARAATDAIRDLGQAEPGDKTIIDGLVPLVDALARAASHGVAPQEAALTAAAAARAGAAATATMVARLGRASRLGERSRGHPDPGAVSLAIIVEALARTYASTPVDASASHQV